MYYPTGQGGGEYSEFKVSGQENYKQPYKVIYPNFFTMALFTA